MKLFTKLVGVFLLIAFAAQAVATEEIKVPALPAVEERTPGIEYTKIIAYGSLSVCPGVGVSMQTRSDYWGTALDVKLGGLMLFGFPVLSADYNFLCFARSNKQSLYGSCGIGGATFLPSHHAARLYVPVRVGVLSGSGFTDIGAKIFFISGVPFPVPSPEVRVGFSF